MKEPNVLTQKEEKSILNFLIRSHAKNIGYGSSRMTFQLDRERIVKVAVSSEGVLQNRAEVDCFEECPEENMLTRIFAYGRLILVCEKVTLVVDASRDDYDSLCESLIENEQDDIEKQLEKTIEWLEERYGETEDNLQLGQNKDGYIVCLDYGFDSTNNKCEIFVGNMDDLSEDNSDRAILKLAKYLLRFAYKDLSFNSERLSIFFTNDKNKIKKPRWGMKKILTRWASNCNFIG